MFQLIVKITQQVEQCVGFMCTTQREWKLDAGVVKLPGPAQNPSQ